MTFGEWKNEILMGCYDGPHKQYLAEIREQLLREKIMAEMIKQESESK